MIEIGKYNTLEILRHTSVGLYLGDESGEDVLLPNKYCPEEYEIGGKLEVFVYRDYAERKIATNIDPKIKLHEFAFLQVTAVSEVGAFLDWGLEKDLLVPFKEQRQKMEQGRWYVVYLNIDEKSYRLYASNKTDKFLSNDNLTIEEGDMVSLMALSRSEIGYNVIVNNKHKGLVFANEVFRTLNVGDRLTGYVKKIREDNKIDITLQPIGYEQFNDVNVNRLISLLETNNGVLLLSDKSSPDEIYAVAGMSKKAFKRAVGALYKAGRVVLEKEKTILKS
ncbi:MAG: GntR family transcriptional regulator [Marinilabiliales bacterium]|nr:MAG: GntR family transcriptional regulator [Marinilabiliales bacterium]